jgi:predicted Fe-Mo cluster-binding NifX family protein
MKIAVSSTGNTLESPVDERFGRAAYFLVVNLDDDSFEVIDNGANAAAAGGAGVQAAQNVIDTGVEWIITGSVGPKAFAVMQNSGTKIGTGASGTVRDVIVKFKDGGFVPIDQGQCGPSGVGKGGGGGGGRGGGRGRG